MTEAEWLASTTVQPMLRGLRLDFSIPPRKLRLFACACCRDFCGEFFATGGATEKEVEKVLDAVEEYAEGRLDGRRLAAVRKKVEPLINKEDWIEPVVRAAKAGKDAYRLARDTADQVVSAYSWMCVPCEPYATAEARIQQRLVRCAREVFGNPFRPVLYEPGWLAWNDSIIVKLAQSIDEEKAYQRMGILGDALEEAGCTDSAMLDHCRKATRHHRGCWLVDGLLGKN
jgi:hypothetical protein